MIDAVSRAGRSTVRYRDLFRNREFSALFVADVLSRIGSQLGKFALAALVYERTNSPALTAATFAVTYLPGVLGGPVLSTLADRFPRRQLLISCDLLRAALTAVIALGTPRVEVALAVLLLVEFVRVPFGAARMAILSDILDGDRFVAGNALVGTSQQVVQVVGFAAGGFIVVLVGAQPALLADMATYVLSAVLLGMFVVRRPAPAKARGQKANLLRDTWEGIRVVRDTGRMPTLFWLLFLGPTVLATAEGLAIPYAEQLGLGTQAAGAFLAAPALGSAVGLVIVGRMTQRRREIVLVPFSLAVGLCVAAAGLTPFVVVITGGLFLAGVAMGHIAHLQATIVGIVDQDVRGRVIGLGNTVLQIGQGLSILLAGVVAQATSIRSVLVCSGFAAAFVVLLVSVVGSPHGGRHRADPRAQRRQRRELQKARDLALARARRHRDPIAVPPPESLESLVQSPTYDAPYTSTVNGSAGHVPSQTLGRRPGTQVSTVLPEYHVRT
ncbi:MFS transporter [Actinopolymorpha alba]|uniref:MFS transporter n=1 Tax=Actinopolymorpha alba TaxID=533267 RepID=UPI000375FB2D|nr:MFS transporter [Actinopolymorpha alba]